MDFGTIKKRLEINRYKASVFSSKEKAAAYLNGEIHHKTVGFGDSQTLHSLNLYALLEEHNTVHSPARARDDAEFLRIAAKCLTTQVYLTSVNAMSEDGALVNIDGTGNRVAGSLFGHEKVYFVAGRNKIAPTLELAVWRARNIAAPLNAQRLKCNTPCAVNGDKCYDCKSPERICNGLVIHLKKMNDMEMEVVLIDEDLGL